MMVHEEIEGGLDRVFRAVLYMFAALLIGVGIGILTGWMIWG